MIFSVELGATEQTLDNSFSGRFSRIMLLLIHVLVVYHTMYNLKNLKFIISKKLIMHGLQGIAAIVQYYQFSNNYTHHSVQMVV